MALNEHLRRAERVRRRRSPRRRSTAADPGTGQVIDLRPHLVPDRPWVSDPIALPILGAACDADALAELYLS